MTLQARVLIGLALIAVVLVGVGVAVPRITADYLIGQVDDRLAASDLPGREPDGFFDEPFEEPFGDEDDDRAEPATSTYE